MDEYFVGRTAELAVLDSMVRGAVSGSTQFVVITGPAWIGKTTLIRQFLDTRMPRTRWATGDEDETALQGGLLEQFGLAVESGAETLRAGPALLAMLREWAMPARAPGAVLVIDDAQWGDQVSLSAVSYALRRLRDESLLVVLAMRDDGYAHLPPGLVRVINDRGATIELSGLDVAEIGELARRAGVGPLPARAARRLREHTDGVPLHVREVLHAVPRESLCAALSAPEVALPIPKSLEVRVLSDLAGCCAQGQRLVAAAAVLGTACRIGDAAALADLADPLPALQEAARAGLLAETATIDGRCCEFPRASVRAAVYGGIGVSQRAALHRKAARLTSGARALAHRVAACPGTDGKLARDLAEQAQADQAAGGWPRRPATTSPRSASPNAAPNVMPGVTGCCSPPSACSSTSGRAPGLGGSPPRLPRWRRPPGAACCSPVSPSSAGITAPPVAGSPTRGPSIRVPIRPPPHGSSPSPCSPGIAPGRPRRGRAARRTTPPAFRAPASRRCSPAAWR